MSDNDRTPTAVTLADATMEEIVREIKGRVSGMVLIAEAASIKDPTNTVTYLNSMGSWGHLLGMLKYAEIRFSQGILEGEAADDDDKPGDPPPV